MAAFDNTVQKMITLAGAREETGRVTAVGVSGYTFTIATKLKKVLWGFGVMEGDGLIAYAATGAPTNGQVTFTRVGPIETSADVCNYVLRGF